MALSFLANKEEVGVALDALWADTGGGGVPYRAGGVEILRIGPWVGVVDAEGGGVGVRPMAGKDVRPTAGKDVRPATGKPFCSGAMLKRLLTW